MSKLESLFSQMTVKGLVDAFVATDHNNDPEIPTVRGWIMDELERRCPAQFENWMDGNGPITEYF